MQLWTVGMHGAAALREHVTLMKKCSLWAAVITDVSESVILSQAKKWYQQVVAGCVRATAENALAQVRSSMLKDQQIMRINIDWIKFVTEQRQIEWLDKIALRLRDTNVTDSLDIPIWYDALKYLLLREMRQYRKQGGWKMIQYSSKKQDILKKQFQSVWKLIAGSF